MNRPWIRRTALALGALLLLLAVAAGVFVATFDANRYKGLAIDWMKNERQRTLAIDGPIELSVFPRLALKVSKLRLSEPERARGSEFASVDEASLAVQVWPLLSKQLVIDRVSAKGVRAIYRRDAKGVRNIDDLVAGDTSAPSGPLLRFDISAVQLDDVQLRIRDDLAKLAGDITLQSFTSGRLANQAETPVTLRASVNLSQPQPLKLTLDGGTTLKLDLDKNALTLSRLKLDVQGDAAGVKGASLALDVKKLFFDSSGQQLELDSLKLAVLGKFAGKQGTNPFELALDWPQLAVTAQQIKGSALTGRYQLGGPTLLAGTLRSGAPSGNFEALRLPGMTLTLAGNAGPRKIDGTAKADVLLRMDRGAVAFERLDVAATIAEPGLQPLQLALRGNAGIDAKGAQWTLAGGLNSNRFESHGSAALGGAVPHIKASARFDNLDLNKLLGPDKATPTATAPADAVVPLDGLRAVNGQFSFSAGALALRQYKVADATIDATLDNGLLRIARLAGRAWGGSLDGSGSADARSQRIAVKLAASGVNVNALLKDVSGKDLLEGSGRVTADLNTSGTSLGALRSNLAGTAALQLRDGAVKGINLARTLRQARAALSMKQDAVAKARATEKTDFSELTASARIANGVAQSDDLDVKSPFLRIGGAGRFDIGRGSIDYTARASVIPAAAGQDAGELAALRGVTVPVHLSGPFEAIDWKIQWSGVAAAAVENKLKEKLSEKLGAKLGIAPVPAGTASAPATPKDKLKEKLKGFFK
ncbi:MAG: AsmA family protein [Burkholderiaceae bacterium]|nr:AsmA family protein [Burkholderiaceae bacterium]